MLFVLVSADGVSVSERGVMVGGGSGEDKNRGMSSRIGGLLYVWFYVVGRFFFLEIIYFGFLIKFIF